MRGLLLARLDDRGQLVTRHRGTGRGHYIVGVCVLLVLRDICNHASSGRLLRGCLVLALVPSSALLLSGYRDSLHIGTFDSLLDGRGVFWAALGRLGNRATNFIVEAKNVPHHRLDLGVPQPVASHCDKLFRPQFDEFADFSGGHHDSTDKRQLIILEELVLLEAFACEDLRIVLQDASCVSRRGSERAVC